MGWIAARSKHNLFVHPSFLLPPPPSTPREAVLLFSFFSFLPSPHPPQLYKSLIKLSLHRRTAQGTRSRAHSSRMAQGILGLMRPLRSGLSARKIRLVFLCGVTEQHHSPAKWWSERGFSSIHGLQDAPGESR